MIDLKRDFKIFISLNVLSGVHEVTGIMTAILQISFTFGNREGSSFERECSLHVFSDEHLRPPHNKYFQFLKRTFSC